MENLANNDSLQTVDEENPVNEDSESFDPKFFLIDGKGFYLKMLPLHLVSIALMWLILRLTIFTMSVATIQQHPLQFWGASIIVAVCVHMAAFGKLFQNLAEIGEVMDILKKNCDGTKNELWSKVSTLQEKGTAEGTSSGKPVKIFLGVDEESDNVVMSIQ